MIINWGNINNQSSKEIICGFCNAHIQSEKGYNGVHNPTGRPVQLYYCHKCGRLNYFDEKGTQYPGPSMGEEVLDVTDETVKDLYSEARKCCSTNSYTASVLCSRKLLMNIAVSKGAKEGLSFAEYVKFLAEKGYVPPGGEDWVDHIRKKGNEATHEIIIMGKGDAEELIIFLEMLLKFIYEFPNRIKRKIIPEEKK
ncbi:MAG: DUF4145 domain-containing protein [Ignavibacteriaceae bacterium]|jgi:hypothetical protein